MKRSSQVALLLAGVTTAGGAGYAMMAPNDCATQERPAAVAPGTTDQQRANCSTSSRSSHSSHSYGSNRGVSDDHASSHGSSSSSHASLGGGTSWGGFGGTGHSFHSSGS